MQPEGVKNAATHETIRSKKLRQDAIRRYLVHQSDAKAKWLAITAIKRESQVAISAGSVRKNEANDSARKVDA